MTATATALPRPSELGIHARTLYHGAVAYDYALRTALASAVSGAALPGALMLDGRREARRLEFYAELASGRDAGAVFAPPPGNVRVRAVAGDGPGEPGGRVELLRFRSPYVPAIRDLRAEYRRHEHNATARAQHWRHEGGPRQTLCVIHGFGASPAWLNSWFFSLRSFFRDGWDVVLFTMPFHGGRRGPRAPFNGAEMFARGYSGMCEALLQAVCDFRVVMDHLERTGAPRIGVTGISLGGYMTGLLAAVEPRLDFAIPNAAVTSMPRLLASWFPVNVVTDALRRLKQVPPDLVDQGLAVHSPLTYRPVLPKGRLMIVGGLGDRLAPPEQSLLLWEHWKRPRLHWFPGSHVIHFERRDYLDAMRELMRTRRRSRGPRPAR